MSDRDFTDRPKGPGVLRVSARCRDCQRWQSMDVYAPMPQHCGGCNGELVEVDMKAHIATLPDGTKPPEGVTNLTHEEGQVKQKQKQRGDVRRDTQRASATSTLPKSLTCVCGHAVEEHGNDPVYPGSTSCVECDCIAYEADCGTA